MPKIMFQPSGVSIDVQDGTSILDASFQAQVKIPTTCGGKASCRLCIVKILEGDKFISQMGFSEQNLLGNVFFITKERLSCQTKVFGDVVVEIIEQIPKTVKKQVKVQKVDREENKEAREENAESAFNP